MPSGSKIDTGVSIAMGLCAVAMTLLVAVRELRPTPERGLRKPEAVADWQAYASVGHRTGPADARVLITEFSDFQCPYCARLNKTLRTVRDRHPSDVAIVYRHFPLTGMHPFAYPAAVASECAAAQGRFDAYHDAIFDHQDSLGKTSWVTVALTAGVADTGRFTACLRDSISVATVKADIDAGKRLKVTATPTVMVNGWRLFGTPSDSTLEQLITNELGGRRGSRG